MINQNSNLDIELYRSRPREVTVAARPTPASATAGSPPLDTDSFLGQHEEGEATLSQTVPDHVLML
jgi:hypothetical protein